VNNIFVSLKAVNSAKLLGTKVALKSLLVQVNSCLVNLQITFFGEAFVADLTLVRPFLFVNVSKVNIEAGLSRKGFLANLTNVRSEL
jgi:hypothetical protein